MKGMKSSLCAGSAVPTKTRTMSYDDAARTAMEVPFRPRAQIVSDPLQGLLKEKQREEEGARKSGIGVCVCPQADGSQRRVRLALEASREALRSRDTLGGMTWCG